MRIKVCLFGGLRHAAGERELAVQLDEGTTTGRLLEILHESHPAIKRLSKLTVVSLNDTLATGDELLRDGDEVSMLSALAGG